MSRIISLVLLLASVCAAEPRWRMKYFFDEDRSAFQIVDFRFVSERTGFAAGVQSRNFGRPKPVMLVTRDAGANWTFQPLDDLPLSMFFLDENRGWVVTAGGVYATTDSGAVWKRVLRRKGILRVYFVTPDQGWAVGARKTIMKTSDAGRSWQELESSALPDTSVENTVFNVVEFLNPKIGMITGRSKRPERGVDPSDPESQLRPEHPALSIFLETRDGGAKWTHSTASLFGTITRLRMTPQGSGLALIEYSNGFTFPSEVMMVDFRTGKSSRVFAHRDLVVTDTALLNGTAYVMGCKTEGRLARSPVPSRVRVLASTDMTRWNEMPVDYRAEANHVFASGTSPENLWLATDTGMILKLEDAAAESPNK